MTLNSIIYARPAVMAGLVVFTTACAGGSAQRASLESEISDIRASQARQIAEIDQIKEELRALKGEVEEIQYVAIGKTKELESRLKNIGSRVPPPDGVPIDLLNDDEEKIRRNSGEAAELFSRGLEQIRSGDFNASRQSFDTFTTEYPGTAFTDNAFYWLGISFEKLGQYDRAIVAFSKAFEEYPAEDRAPAALFRLSEVFEKIGSHNEAILALQQLVDEYSKSTFAAQARTRINELRKRAPRTRR